MTRLVMLPIAGLDGKAKWAFVNPTHVEMVEDKGKKCTVHFHSGHTIDVPAPADPIANMMAVAGVEYPLGDDDEGVKA